MQEEGYTRYKPTDEVNELDENGYDRVFLYYTLFTENELMQRYDKAGEVWFDVTTPYMDYD